MSDCLDPNKEVKKAENIVDILFKCSTSVNIFMSIKIRIRLVELSKFENRSNKQALKVW